MKRIAWAAPVVAGLTVGVPMVAHAATDPSPTVSAGSTATAAVGKVAGVVPAPAPATTPKSASTVHPADATATSPAPAGSAEAYAVQLGSIAAISHTSASASSSGAASTADPVEIGGKPLSSQFGGTQTGPGTTGGSLVDTGPGQPLRLAVTPWSATNSQSADGASASAIADILALDLGDPTTPMSARVRVLQSKSDATWTPAASTGSASSDGAIVNLGGPSGLDLDVLHSQTDTSGKGSSYLLSVNGHQIGTSQQTNGACALGVPDLLTLDCLTAGGGVAGPLTTATAGVLTATVGSGSSSLTANALQSVSSSGAAPAAPAIAAGSGSAPSQSGGGVTTGSGPDAGAAGSAAGSGTVAASAATGGLPFTGIDALGLIAAAMTLTSAGGLIVVASRRRLRPIA